MDAFTPAQTTELVSRIGAKKARMGIDKMFINSFMGGALISFGCALALSTNASPWFQTNAPGLIRTISAMVFPVGLIMVVLTGADLFTSYCMYSVVALLHRRCSFLDLLKTWFVSFFGNLAGALFFMAVLTGYGGTFETGAYLDEALAFAKAKAVTPKWHQIFLKGILCNWLVCMAVFLAISSREVISKIISIWFPVMCFVGLGTDHVIANTPDWISALALAFCLSLPCMIQCIKNLSRTHFIADFDRRINLPPPSTPQPYELRSCHILRVAQKYGIMPDSWFSMNRRGKTKEKASRPGRFDRLFRSKGSQIPNAEPEPADSGSSVRSSAAASITDKATGSLETASATPQSSNLDMGASNAADSDVIALSLAQLSSVTGVSNTPTTSNSILPPRASTPAPGQETNRDPSSSDADADPVRPAPRPSGQPAIVQYASTAASQTLWSQAYKKLSDKEREAVQSPQPTAAIQGQAFETRIEDLLCVTREAQMKCENDSFKFRFRGKEVILGDVAGKICFWLNKFKEVGDVAVNFDPVHASLPWAGVRFLLQRGLLIVTAEKLSCLINRGAIYERLYHPGTIPSDVLRNLHESMVEMYATMLRMMALYHRLLDKNFAKRAIHAIFNKDVSELLQKCEELEVQVHREVHVCEGSRSQGADTQTQRLLAILQEPILRTDERVLRLLEKTEQSEVLKILDWVSNVLYGSNHQTVRDKRTTNTCEWLLMHERYREWQDESASIIIWLCGNPGSGKTFLTSKVIDDIQGTLKSGPNEEGFAFFYCNRNEAQRREPLSVLRAFVRQLSTTANNEQLIQKGLKQFYREARLKASELTLGDCKKLLLEFINMYPRTTLVLDALDECEKHKRLELIQALEELLSQSSKPLKIFISSRLDTDINDRLKDRANIRIEAKDNHHDITKFVNNEISKHPSWRTMDHQLQQRILETLQDRSQGMFQWAFLQTKQLLDLDLEEDILARLGKLPDDLKQAYDEIYKSMNKAEKRYADRAFQWVMCACHPITSKELLPAICQDENSDDLKPLGGLNEDLLLKYCHNLLVIDPVRKVWIPSHLSVIEYFEDHLWNQSQANCLVSSVCLLVLQNAVFYNREKAWNGQNNSHSTDSSKDSLARGGDGLTDPLHGQGFHRLSLYTRHHWPIHAQKSDAMGNRNRVRTRLEAFLGHPTNSSAAYRCWHRMVTIDDSRIQRTSIFTYRLGPRYLAPDSITSFSYSAFGLATILPDWHDSNWVKDDNRNETGETFLELTGIFGSILGCRHLIGHGAEVNVQTESGYGSALVAAASQGKKEIVEFLVKEGGAEVLEWERDS
ncbi:hypothetical protein G7Y89_g10427 [Cudoniella acicularis]|uniref:Nephrocystin 3-like N-terminal domain-containing protein n=1 Tax=Cudoniella acicularis TaxID=354080 RepID=A0A8H4RGG9_9HELO|nr:hypothetical protein G7Y89_g10427 [Cudoniella acicularis]